MAEFIITSPEGQKFKITAPEGAKADDLPDLSGVKPKQQLPPDMQPPTATMGERFRAGFMDPFVGAEQLARHSGLGGEEEYDKYVQQREQELRRKGVGSTDIPRLVGSTVNPLNLMPAGGAARTARPLARVLSGAVGGGIGAATQPVVDEDFATTKAEQAAVGVGSGAVLGGLSKLARYKDYTPSLDELHRDGSRLYDQLQQSNARIKRSNAATLADIVEQQLRSRYFRERFAPETFAAVKELREFPWMPPGQNPTVMDIDQIQQVLKNSLASPDQRERAAARVAQDMIDQYISNIPANAVVSGNPQADAATLREAQSIWRAYRRSEAVETGITRAELRTSSTGTGANIDNATRQQARRILEGPEGRRMSQAERDDLESIIRGTPTGNALRWLGKFAPSGPVSGMSDLIGLASGNVKPSMIKNAIAVPAKLGGDYLTRRAMREAGANIRRQSPTAQGRPPTPPPWYMRPFQLGAVAPPTIGAALAPQGDALSASQDALSQ